MFLETDEDISTIKSSWVANTLLEISRVVVNHGDVKSKLRQLKYMTVQLDMDGAPDEWSLPHKDGNIGVFLGLTAHSLEQTISLQKTSFAPVFVKLMRPAELSYALEHDAVGREKLAQLYRNSEGLEHISNLSRHSVI